MRDYWARYDQVVRIVRAILVYVAWGILVGTRFKAWTAMFTPNRDWWV